MNGLLIAITLTLITGGQLLQKMAADKASHGAAQRSLAASLVRQPETWWAALCLGAGMCSWLAVLYRMEVSQAYPYLGLGYVLVLLASHFWLGEHISRGRWFGVLLIVFGIGVLSLG
jgi:undecaprenyl phosphate-alpha-L-ara4N flippase subunit ArnE